MRPMLRLHVLIEENLPNASHDVCLMLEDKNERYFSLTFDKVGDRIAPAVNELPEHLECPVAFTLPRNVSLDHIKVTLCRKTVTRMLVSEDKGRGGDC